MTGNFIIGLPHETKESFLNWSEWVFSDDCPLTWINFNPLYISQHGDTTHSASEFYKNYGQYGYEMYNGHLWKNQYWNFLECGKLALDLNSKALNSNKQKIPALYAIGLQKYGYSYYDLIQQSEKTLYSENYKFFNINNGTNHQISNQFDMHFNKFKTDYITHLRNKLKI
jgi:hypothetical protein